MESVVRTDIENRDDIATLVETFYTRAFADELLGHIFIDVAQMDLEEHMPIMCDFWESLLFRTGTYRRNAFSVHAVLNDKVTLTSQHFQRWLDIWIATVEHLHSGPNADNAIGFGSRMAGGIHHRLRVSEVTS